MLNYPDLQTIITFSPEQDKEVYDVDFNEEGEFVCWGGGVWWAFNIFLDILTFLILSKPVVPYIYLFHYTAFSPPHHPTYLTPSLQQQPQKTSQSGKSKINPPSTS